MREFFIPSNRYGYILGTILIIVLGISLLNFPSQIFSVTSLDPTMKFHIGWPMQFFEVDILNPGVMPVDWTILILSFIGYAFVAYVLDVLINVIISGFTRPKSREEILTQARKAYFYYKSQGMEGAKIRDLFKQKGWKDEDISKLN
jgi:hypothetical protein